MYRKLSVLLLAAGMLLGATAPSQAVDFKIKGMWQFGFEHSNVAPRRVENAPQSNGDNFNASQRFRIALDAVANENLSGTVEVEIGAINWGQNSTGGAMGADGQIVEVRYAYLDWLIPNTRIKTRMGLQLIRLPGLLSQWGFGPIFGKEMAGITVNAPIVEDGPVQVDATLFWARPYNDNSSTSTFLDNAGVSKNNRTTIDNMDVFGLILPVKGDGFKISPWGMYSLIGKYSLSGLGAGVSQARDPGLVAPRGGLMPILGGWQGMFNKPYTAFEGDSLKGLDRAWGDGWWAGLVGDFNLGALRLGFEGAYGSVNMGEVKNYQGFREGKGKTFEVRREGWYVGGRADYKTDWGTPGLIAWYGSGDDSNPYNGSERLPQFNTPWGVTALGGGGGIYDEATWKVLGHNPAGTVGVVAQIADMSFVDNLKHTLRFGYYWGTNSAKMPRKTGMAWPTGYARPDGAMGYLTTMDTAWEANLVNTYKIYDNLTFALEGAYVRLNLDKSTWKYSGRRIGHDNYRVNCLFTYNF